MNWLAALLLVIGLGLAGADGAWFPWINLVGVGLLIGFAALVKRPCQEGSLENVQADCCRQDFFQHS